MSVGGQRTVQQSAAGSVQCGMVNCAVIAQYSASRAECGAIAGRNTSFKMETRMRVGFLNSNTVAATII